MGWEVTSSRVVYRNRWMEVQEDEFLREDGSPGLYAVVHKPDYAVILPIDNERIYMVQQYRYPVSGQYWELPQGSWEDEPGKNPAELARAELREETGLDAGELEHVGHLFQAYGYSNQGFNIFIARSLVQGEQQLDPEEADLRCVSFSVEEVKSMIATGQIKDATTVAVFGMLQIRGLLSFEP
jgi:ADP-ribose pyrophosphatase